MSVVTILYLVYLFLPMALLLLGSFGESWTNTLLPRGATLRWYADVLGDPSFRRAFRVSLTVTAATCAAGAVLALPLAYAMYRSGVRGVATAARVAAILPVAVPPLTLGFAYILVFSSDQLPWLGSIWLLVAGHVVLTLPYLLQTLLADMRHLGLERMEQAAESLGATRLRALADVLLPQVLPSAVVAFCLTAAVAIGAYGTALSLVLLALCSLVMAAGETFAARRKGGTDVTLA